MKTKFFAFFIISLLCFLNISFPCVAELRFLKRTAGEGTFPIDSSMSLSSGSDYGVIGEADIIKSPTNITYYYNLADPPTALADSNTAVENFIKNAFAEWDNPTVTNLTFTCGSSSGGSSYTRDSSDGRYVVSWEPLGANNPYSYVYITVNSSLVITDVDIVLNSNIAWACDNTWNLPSTASLPGALVHAIGHLLGIAHLTDIDPKPSMYSEIHNAMGEITNQDTRAAAFAVNGEILQDITLAYDANNIIYFNRNIYIGDPDVYPVYRDITLTIPNNKTVKMSSGKYLTVRELNELSIGSSSTFTKVDNGGNWGGIIIPSVSGDIIVNGSFEIAYATIGINIYDEDKWDNVHKFL